MPNGSGTSRRANDVEVGLDQSARAAPGVGCELREPRARGRVRVEAQHVSKRGRQLNVRHL